MPNRMISSKVTNFFTTFCIVAAQCPYSHFYGNVPPNQDMALSLSSDDQVKQCLDAISLAFVLNVKWPT